MSKMIMKRLLILACLAIAGVCPVRSQGATITVKFDYDFTGTTLCSLSVTTNCLDHFESGFLVGSAFTSALTIPVLATSVGIVTGISGGFSSAGKLGNQTVAAVMVGKDGAGGRITSDPLLAQSTVTIRPAAPKNLSLP